MPGRMTNASRIVDAIKTSAFSTDSTQMRLIKDACNVYKRFIEHFSKITIPINDHLQKAQRIGLDGPFD